MIRIPSKADKQLAQLKDALRILAWQTYKSENDVNGLDGYAQFQQEWQSNEIQQMPLPKLEKFIRSLGYSQEELLDNRSHYYERRQLVTVA